RALAGDQGTGALRAAGDTAFQGIGPRRRGRPGVGRVRPRDLWVGSIGVCPRRRSPAAPRAAGVHARGGPPRAPPRTRPDGTEEDHVVAGVDLADGVALGPGERVVVENGQSARAHYPRDLYELLVGLRGEQHGQLAAALAQEVDHEPPPKPQRRERTALE